jgi:prepilin-type N-terminal cleavage/methylation domain-containing protein
VRCARAPRAGFTIVEVVVAVLLLAIVMVALFGTIMQVQRDYARQRDTIRAVETLRYVEGVITGLLRTAENNPRTMDSTLLRLDVNPLNRPAFDNIRVRADFNPADGDSNDPLEDVLLSAANDTLYVRWRAGAALEPLAYPVREMRFEYFSAGGVPLTTRAMADSAKRVRFRLAAPAGGALAPTTYRKDVWVFLRNRL